MPVFCMCLALLGLGAEASDTAWHRGGLQFPRTCFKQALISDRCGHAMKSSKVYNQLQEIHLKRHTERELFESSLKTCALDIMNAQEFQNVCASLNLLRKAITCFRKVAAAKGAPTFKQQVETMYNKYWVCVATTFKRRPGYHVELDRFVRRKR